MFEPPLHLLSSGRTLGPLGIAEPPRARTTSETALTQTPRGQIGRRPSPPHGESPRPSMLRSHSSVACVLHLWHV